MKEFPGSPVIRTLYFHHQHRGFNPWLETKIPKAARPGKKKKLYY